MSRSNPYTKSPIHITQGTGKMIGIVSINSSTLANPFCEKMSANPAFICSKCYANRFESMYSALHQCLMSNSELLSNAILADEDIPIVFQDVCRLHSYGELINETHFRNFCKIAEHNPHCLFTLWTKRLNLIDIRRPSNLRVIYSNPKIDDPFDQTPFGADGVFNVISANYALEHSITPNCRGSCRMCMRCYNRDRMPGIIVEVEKNDQSKWEKAVKA
jgi:hypothetical protein